MKLKLAMATALALSLAACAKTDTAKPAADTAKISDAVKADADRYVAAISARDLDKSMSHDAPGIVVIFHGAPNTTGPDQDRAATKPLFDADPALHMSVHGETVDVAQAGDLAIYRATYTITSTDPKTKKVRDETGNWVAVYKPQPDGSWKIALNMFSDLPPTAPAAPEKK